MNVPPQSLPTRYPASRFASALGIGKRAVLVALRNVSSTPGDEGAKTWQFHELPASLQSRLHTTARARGFRDAHNLLAHCRDEETSAVVPRPAAASDKFASLRGVIAGFTKPSNPTASEQRYLWDCVFALVGQVDKRELVDFLAQHAPFLAKSAGALQRNFNRLFQRWQGRGGELASLDDQRRGRPRGPELGEEDFKLLVAYAAKYGGGCDQAWREAKRKRVLREEIVAYYFHHDRMPPKFREKVRHAASDARNRLHGPRHTKLTGPYINRNPDHPGNPLLAGQWDQSDDLTLPCAWHEQREDGTFWVGQGQFLAWIDERSWLLYNFVLIPDKAYNAWHIRNSWTQKCDAHGLPSVGLYLEGNLWQNARMWAGRRNEVPWNQTEMGIRRLGLRIRQAMLPRGKIIERIFGDLQNYFETEPGYVGRNPITDKYEAVQKQIRLVNSGQAHPSEFFYSKQQWAERLTEWCHQYNHTPKHGKYHDGLTPQQVYEKHFVGELVKIPDDCRHLLASNKIEATIGRNGLSFQYGRRRFTYKSEALGRMRLRDPRVIVWINPEDMSLCGVTDRDGGNPIVAPLETDVPSHDAPAELLSRAHAENAAFSRPGKELYRSLKPVFSEHFAQQRFRANVSDGLAAETGREFRAQGEALKAEQSSKQRIDHRARRLGLNVSRNDPRYEQRVEAAGELTDWIARHEQEDTP